MNRTDVYADALDAMHDRGAECTGCTQFATSPTPSDPSTLADAHRDLETMLTERRAAKRGLCESIDRAAERTFERVERNRTRLRSRNRNRAYFHLVSIARAYASDPDLIDIAQALARAITITRD